MPSIEHRAIQQNATRARSQTALSQTALSPVSHALVMKVMAAALLIAGGLFSAQHAFANETQAVAKDDSSAKSTLIYISPNDYNYSVRLLHPYYDYWFEQGPIVAPIALSAFQATGQDVAMCNANETADQVIRVKPSLFYNPQLRVFHSRLVATIYAGNGQQLESYVGEAQHQGFMAVNHATNMHLNKAYAAAMEDLMQKIASGQTTEVKSKVNTANLYDAKVLPCGFIGQQAEPRISFY